MAAEGKVYGEVGVKTTPDMEVYTDGKKPQVCIDLPVYVFAEAGYSVKVFGYDMASGKKPIYDASNSPVKLCYHIEDGNCVPACTRPDSSSRVGKRGYYTSPSLQIRILRKGTATNGNHSITIQCIRNRQRPDISIIFCDGCISVII